MSPRSDALVAHQEIKMQALSECLSRQRGKTVTAAFMESVERQALNIYDAARKFAIEECEQALTEEVEDLASGPFEVLPSEPAETSLQVMESVFGTRIWPEEAILLMEAIDLLDQADTLRAHLLARPAKT